MRPDEKRKRNISNVKIYGILARNLKTGAYSGYIDASICSMGWSPDFIYLWAVPPYHYCKKTHIQNGWEVFIVRINSKKCPIKLNCNLKHRNRNYQFIVKDK